MRDVTLYPTGFADYKSGVKAFSSERFLMRITNGASPTSSFEIHKAAIFTRPLFSSR